MKQTPLIRKTPLRQGACTLRRTPIAPVSQKRIRENRERAVVVSGMRLAAGGRCARCGRTGLPVRGHERLARAHGGDIVNPDCVLCDPCNGWCEDNPPVAAWTGWKLSTKLPHDPALGIGQAWDLHGNLVDFSTVSTGIDSDGASSLENNVLHG
jgi:hypothetical protein